MQVAELEGALLDYWVGRALGLNGIRLGRQEATYISTSIGINVRETYSPSTNWAHGGPIIESEQIDLAAPTKDDDYWTSNPTPWPNEALSFGVVSGRTPLVAAMRAYVASKFGSDVGEVPPPDRAPPGMMS
jgi:hypothetical protein